MKKCASRLFAALSFAASLSCFADYKLNLQTPVTELGERVYELHTLLLWICVGISIVVFGAMFYAILKHRKSAGHKAANFHESVTIEIIWTIIPILILVVMAYPATKLILAQKDSSGADMTIKVTGYQWKWGYDYLNEGVSFHSRLVTPQSQYDTTEGPGDAKGEHYLLEVDNPMVVPVGKKVRILTTANDVIHSFWVPALAVKLDAIPGFIRDTWFKVEKEGTYRGQCTELCGKDHGFMPIVVVAVSQEKYDAWVADQKKKMAADQDDPNKVWTMPDMMARGQKVYEANCKACHQVDGKGMPPGFPALDGSKIAGDKAHKADHINLVLTGKGNMPKWGDKLSDTEIAAVITYERNSWSNKTGDLVQPADVKAARK
ncbi:MAG: cytochrome c oxidase subunit II [Burkholderiales bacterium]|nr:cytochrome c oxidase subunit II [Burkholderiales bacterium]